MELREANVSDIPSVLELLNENKVDSLTEEERGDGFITTQFTYDQLLSLITTERGLFVAADEDRIVAFAMAASWAYWISWPLFQHMVQSLPELKYKGIPLNVDNSYQYGPVCVHRDYRGQGVFERVFQFSLTKMRDRFKVLITFVNKTNGRSFSAHARKAKLDILKEFDFNGQQYLEMACMTKQCQKEV